MPSTTSPLGPSGAGDHSTAPLLALIEGLRPDLRERAFTHPSFVEDRARSYERLEFLGDSVLDLAVARELYERFPEFPEGKLTKVCAYVVSRASCAIVGRKLEVGERLAAGAGAPPGEDLAALARNRNVLAALVEAVLGALYLQNGFDAIRGAIVEAFAERIEYALTSHVDHKTELQEELARRGARQVVYEVLATEGPPHERLFTCAAIVDGRRLGTGEGPSKKTAEQIAAREALSRLATS